MTAVVTSSRKRRSFLTRFAALLFTAGLPLLVACGDSPVEDEDDDLPPPDPRALPVLGLGASPERYVSEVVAVAGWAYLATWGPRPTARANLIKVFDVSGATPVLADSVAVPDAFTIADLHISDDSTLLLAATGAPAGSIAIFDLQDPGRPRLLSHFSSASISADVHTAKFGRINGRLYAFLNNTADGTIVTVDLEDPENPREVASQRAWLAFVHDVFVRDGLLFAAIWSQGVGIYDVGGGGRAGSAANPVLIGIAGPTTHGTHNTWWFHDPSTNSKRYLFIGEERYRGVDSPAEGDIYAADISDMENPRIVAYYHGPIGGAHNFYLDEANGFLYAAYYNGGVRVLDVRGDLSACTDAQRGTLGRCDLGKMGREVANAVADRQPFVWGVAKIGTRLFASDVLQGLWMIDASGVSR